MLLLLTITMISSSSVIKTKLSEEEKNIRIKIAEETFKKFIDTCDIDELCCDNKNYELFETMIYGMSANEIINFINKDKKNALKKANKSNHARCSRIDTTLRNIRFDCKKAIANNNGSSTVFDLELTKHYNILKNKLLNQLILENNDLFHEKGLILIQQAIKSGKGNLTLSELSQEIHEETLRQHINTTITNDTNNEQSKYVL